ncbi:unnamed protein product [Didymodactylos carnosus]|uniref:Uncharacterized protein n=1 Tax=Didymodactylos carnosus TaxID=1234261 RepID=A0A815EAQ0_9BILA|nr:unnamed protein product [Didymodactylos carnosus]CAF4146354.1 unnamed protein product [Didymodactylos carnosus]
MSYSEACQCPLYRSFNITKEALSKFFIRHNKEVENVSKEVQQQAVEEAEESEISDQQGPDDVELMSEPKLKEEIDVSDLESHEHFDQQQQEGEMTAETTANVLDHSLNSIEFNEYELPLDLSNIVHTELVEASELPELARLSSNDFLAFVRDVDTILYRLVNDDGQLLARPKSDALYYPVESVRDSMLPQIVFQDDTSHFLFVQWKDTQIDHNELNTSEKIEFDVTLVGRYLVQTIAEEEGEK